MGKAVFLKIADRTGELQLYVRRDAVGEESFDRLKRWLDLGDVVGAAGRPMTTRTGEPTLAVAAWRLLTKALRPLPEKWHGLRDAETRYRQRYLDLVANPDVAETFRRRSRLVSALRRFLDARGFLEVETPQLQPLAAGAAARPFRTHHNTLDLPLFLRIAPELYLKRLLVGGFERVYEIGRNFRNEGISTQHNPEFTMLEFYQAYANYQDLMDLTEEMFAAAAHEVAGSTRVKYQGEEIDLTPGTWDRITVRDAILRHSGDDAAGRRAMNENDLGSLEAAVRWATVTDAVPPPDLADALRFAGCADPGKAAGHSEVFAAACRPAPEGAARAALALVTMRIFERVCEKRLRQPTFVTEYPLVVSPLSRRNEGDPALVDRFELYVCGREMANAFSELNDPADQAQRFQEQLAARDRGDAEAMDYDRDYVRALEHGMPPAAGEGVGIDRLAMLLCDRPSIRDVILFPLMRPESGGT
jgi:lysyl-tRNA synthetase class 2